MARDEAAAGMRDYGEHDAADALPTTCPYTLDQITGGWWPDVATLRQIVRSSDILGVLDTVRVLAMAARIRPKAKNLYDEDFYVWSRAAAQTAVRGAGSR
jgi:hypothetical protein